SSGCGSSPRSPRQWRPCAVASRCRIKSSRPKLYRFAACLPAHVFGEHYQRERLAMAVAILGSINLDVAAYMERLPKPGETLHGREYKIGLGGKGANQAVAARKLGS